MTKDASLFIKLRTKNTGKVTFSDDIKEKSIGIGDVGKDGDTFVQNIFAQNVLLVDGYKLPRMILARKYSPLLTCSFCEVVK